MDEPRVVVRGLSSAWLRALALPLIVLAWLAVLVLIGWLLGHLTRTILILVLAAVIAFAFTPLANQLQRWLPRVWAIGLAYLLGLLVVLGFGAYVIGTTVVQVAALVQSLPAYQQQAQALFPQIEGLLAPLGVGPDALTSAQHQAITEVQSAGTTVATESLTGIAAIFGSVIDFILVLILSIYMALDGTRIAHWLRTEPPGRRTRARTRLGVAVISRVIGGYVRGVLTLAALVGFLVGVGMAVLGVPYAMLLGVLAFFMEFVPVLGVFVSGAASVGIAVVSFHEPLKPLLVLAYFVVVHVIEGDVVGPRIMGKAVGIHPATGLIALAAGTELFGVWGALFAAPVAGLLQAMATAAWVEFRTGEPEHLTQVAQAVAQEGDERATELASSVGPRGG
ncbi:MAG: AI-2E family transporter [Chloroflexi bacterium]|nr:AI-2E family transporter [Chloroflexota bacterium]